MRPPPERVTVQVQAFRDMECLGEPCTMEINLARDWHFSLNLPAGGRQLNSATNLRLHVAGLEPFVDGWWTGMASFDVDAMNVGKWRQFQFNIHNSDAPSVVHFAPSPDLIGWGSELTMEQWIYSFSIKPYRAALEASQ